jgi:hypothetical protein
MPKIAVSEITTCLFNGIFMPAIRATYTFLIDEPRLINPYQLTLALLMPRVGADH